MTDAKMMLSPLGNRHWAEGADHDCREWSCTVTQLLEAEWKPLARYGTTATLTYLEDAPAGRGPWFLATSIVTVQEFADYNQALTRWEELEPEPDAAWIITKDLLADENAPEGTNLNAVGVMGPEGIRDDVVTQLLAGKGRAFRMYDDDGEHYYSGRTIGDTESEDGFAPLEHFGRPNAGCTRIDYAYEGGKWVTL